MIWLSSHLTYHLIINDSVMWKRLHTNETNQTQTTESVHVTTTSSVPCLLPTSYPP